MYYTVKAFSAIVTAPRNCVDRKENATKKQNESRYLNFFL